MSVRFIPGGGTGTGTVANPTALVGLTAVNGAASSAIRSDGAPALDQSITPTWTGKHTYNLTMAANTAADGVQVTTPSVASAGNQIDSPAVHFTGQGWATTPVASQPVDYRMYCRPIQGATNPAALFVLDAAVNGGAFSDIMTIPVVPSSGTSIVFFESITANAVRVQGASIPTNGIYNPTTNQLGLSTNGALRVTVEPGGQVRNVIVGAGYSTAEGTNAKQGTATLVAGTVVVANTSVTASSRIFLTAQSIGGTAGALGVSARTAGTSFTILSTSGSDTSVVAYEIFEPS